MDPISALSVTGAVVGIVHLMSSIVRLYEDTFRSLRRHKKWSTDLEHIRRQIRTQKAIFRNECRLMLASLSGQEVAKEMIENYEHPAWADPDLDFKFSGYFGASSPTYARVVRSIEEKLVVIEQEIVEVHIVVEQLPYSKSMMDKSRRSRFQRKLKATSSTSCLSFHLDGLQKLNAEFLALSSSNRDSRWKLSKMDPLTSLKLEQKLEELQFVRRASLQLHYALTLACLAHVEHSGYLSLKLDHVSIQNPGPSSVTFSIAFTGCAVNGDPSGLDTNWLAIKSAFYEPKTEFYAGHDPLAQNPVSAFTSAFATSDDSLHTSIVVHNLKTTKWVRFHTNQASTLQPLAMLPIFDKTDKSLEEFSGGHDFCFYKRSLFLRSRGDICIGYLEMAEPTGTWRHLLYVMPRAPVTPIHLRESTSLAQLYYSNSLENGVGHISIYVRIQLAHKLATAVLCLHSTPWLQPSWESDDLLLLGTDDNFCQRNMPQAFPHLKVRVGNEYRQEKIIAKASKSINEGFPYNSSLFNFGILLLELGYFKPLSSLRDSPDFTNCKEEKITDFVLAKRLSLTLGSQMGSVYARIVQKCLDCDFGKGNDFSDLSTQAFFYQDVVCELERLEECGKELEIGD